MLIVFNSYKVEPKGLNNLMYYEKIQNEALSVCYSFLVENFIITNQMKTCGVIHKLSFSPKTLDNEQKLTILFLKMLQYDLFLDKYWDNLSQNISLNSANISRFKALFNTVLSKTEGISEVTKTELYNRLKQI